VLKSKNSDIFVHTIEFIPFPVKCLIFLLPNSQAMYIFNIKTDSLSVLVLGLCFFAGFVDLVGLMLIFIPGATCSKLEESIFSLGASGDSVRVTLGTSSGGLSIEVDITEGRGTGAI